MDTPIRSFGDLAGCGADVVAGAPATAAANAPQLPPSGNTGGKFPEAGTVHAYAAITDYLNCTFAFSDVRDSLPGFFRKLVAIFGTKFAPVIDRSRGLHGYQKSFSLGTSSALFAFGGQSGTALLSLPGEACSLVRDWGRVIEFLSGFAGAHITRWDGAVDDFAGIHSVDFALACFLEGAFNAGGRAPSHCQHGPWARPDGSGRTLYIGRRKNGKMLRVYEKGMQLGRAWHPWVRWEVELHNIDRVIPWEVLLEPGRYVVGSYPKALGWVQAEMSRVQTIKRQTQISYEHLVGYASRAYGPLLNVMLEVEGNSEAVLEKLHRSGTPRRLQHPYVDSPSDFIDPDSDAKGGP